MSPGISVEFSADRTLASSRCLSDMCDVFLIVMQQQYALAFTHGTMAVARPVTLLCANGCVITSNSSHWFVSMAFLFQFSLLHLDCGFATFLFDTNRKNIYIGCV